MLQLRDIIGNLTDPDLAEQLHQLEHTGSVEYIILSKEDVRRKRFRTLTDRGTDCAIALERSENLENGAVLLLDSTRAVIVKIAETQWLEFKPVNLNAALELGYLAGNLHWQVDLVQNNLRIALASPEQTYLERLAPLINSGRVERVVHG